MRLPWLCLSFLHGGLHDRGVLDLDQAVRDHVVETGQDLR
jgi:hypothetical protein